MKYDSWGGFKDENKLRDCEFRVKFVINHLPLISVLDTDVADSDSWICKPLLVSWFPQLAFDSSLSPSTVI